MKQEVNRRHAPDKWALDDVVMTSEVGAWLSEHKSKQALRFARLHARVQLHWWRAC